MRPSPHYGEGRIGRDEETQITPEKIIHKLAEGGKLLGKGQDLENVTRCLEITESTWRRWRNQ